MRIEHDITRMSRPTSINGRGRGMTRGVPLDCEAQGMVEEGGECVMPEPELDCESQGMVEEGDQCVMPESEEPEEEEVPQEEFVEPQQEFIFRICPINL